jgi:hypothetical protein
MRSSVRPGSTIGWIPLLRLPRSDFQGSTSGSPDAPEDRGTLPSLGPYLDARSFQGPGAARPPLVKRKGKLRPVRRPTSPSSFASPPPSESGFGNFDPIPFRGRGRPGGPPEGGPTVPFPKSIYPLGAINSRPNAVLAKPFSTSAFEVPSRILATATEICTGGRYAPGRPWSRFATPAYAYSSRPPSPPPRGGLRRDGRVWAARSSAIDF